MPELLMGRGHKKVPDDVLLSSYTRTKSIWKTGKEVGLCGQSVQERLNRLGVIENNHWTKEEDEILRNIYLDSPYGDINKAASILGRPYNSVASRASRLKITDYHRPNRDEEKETSSKKMKEWHKNNEHPRGMLGKKHSEEFSKKLSARIKKAWADPESKFNSQETRQLRSDLFSRLAKHRRKETNFSRCKRGYYDIDGMKMYFRSSWEPIYATYLNKLLRMGAIQEWTYEKKTFWFEKIKRGIRSYTPDFEVVHKNGDIEYHEVKGWMDPKSITKIKRMATYFPKIKLVVIDENQFKKIRKKWGV